MTRKQPTARQYGLRLVRSFFLAVFFALAVTLVYEYTRSVSISTNKPKSSNSRLCEAILAQKKVLFIGAHPDDIEWYSGGLVYLLRQRKADIVFAVATRGGKGKRSEARRKLEARRTLDQLKAAEVLGGARVVFYEYPDKSLPQYVESFADDLNALIAQEKPDIIFSWDPNYVFNPHPDHQAAAKSARLAIRRYTSRSPGHNPVFRTCYYGTREPNLWVGYEEDIFRTKLRSLNAHSTEVFAHFFLLARRFLMKRSMGEGKKINAKYAEVFRCADL